MRNVMLSLMLAAAGAIGLAGAAPAQARDARIYVDLGDVSFSYGRPYYRYNNEPLYVVYERGYPRYYRHDRGYRYGGPVYYAPPPVYYYDRYHDRPYYGYNDRRDWRRDHRRDRDRWDRDRRHRGRGWD
jgi:hypothetical protein